MPAFQSIGSNPLAGSDSIWTPSQQLVRGSGPLMYSRPWTEKPQYISLENLKVSITENINIINQQYIILTSGANIFPLDTELGIGSSGTSGATIGPVNLSNTNTVTVSIRFKLNALNADQILLEHTNNYNTIIGSGSFLLYVGTNNRFTVGLGGLTSPVAARETSGWTATQYQVYHAICILKLDGSNSGVTGIQIWIDGVEQNTSTVVNGNGNQLGNFANSTMYLAGRVGGGTAALNGVIGDVSVFDRSLSVSEIQLLFSNYKQCLLKSRRIQIPVSWNPDPGVQNASIAYGPYPAVQRPPVLTKGAYSIQPSNNAAINTDWPGLTFLWNAAQPYVNLVIDSRYKSIIGNLPTSTTVGGMIGTTFTVGSKLLFNTTSKLLNTPGTTRASYPHTLLATFTATTGVTSFITSTTSQSNSGMQIYNASDGTIHMFTSGWADTTFTPTITLIAGELYTVLIRGINPAGTAAHLYVYSHTTKTLQIADGNGIMLFEGDGVAMVGGSADFTYGGTIVNVAHFCNVLHSNSEILSLVMNPWQLFTRKTTQPFPGPRRKLI